ncbi:MAG: GxxExxY protein, partial [Gemmatimonadaceae bacterium]|nr:GxxExxY protein [Gemmatimonadaceae bacterium]
MTLPDNPWNRLTGHVVDSALKVHTILGPGLLEHVYTECLARELRNRGLEVQQQLPVPLVYEGQLLDMSFRLDMLVAHEVVVEVKAVQ